MGLLLALQGGMAVGKTTAARWLAALRRCRAARTLFLEASPAVLRARKDRDITRDRGFFDHTVTHLLPAKRAWFAAQPGTDFLLTDTLTAEQLCEAVHRWVLHCLDGTPIC